MQVSRVLPIFTYYIHSNPRAEILKGKKKILCGAARLKRIFLWNIYYNNLYIHISIYNNTCVHRGMWSVRRANTIYWIVILMKIWNLSQHHADKSYICMNKIGIIWLILVKFMRVMWNLIWVQNQLQYIAITLSNLSDNK